MNLPRYGQPDGDVERRAYAAIVAEAFAGDFEGFEAWVRDFGDNLRVLRNERVQAGLAIYPMGQFFGGVSVPTWGVAGVAVRPEFKGRGLARELMLANLRENFESGPPIATLYPAAPKLYRNLGWEFAGARVTYGVNLGELPVQGHDLTLRPGTQADEELLSALYRKRVEHENGCLDRNRHVWERVRRATKEAPLFCYIAERDGTPEGYVMYTQQRVAPGMVRYDMHVSDMVCTTGAAARALLSHLARSRSVANRAQFRAAPHDPLILDVVQTQEIDVVQRMQWMLRVVRVGDALSARGYNRHVKARASVNIADEVLPANQGPWTLELADGRMNATPGGDGAATLDIRGLAALYTSCMAPSQLRAAGLLSGSNEHDEALASMFAGTAPWMPDFF